jgi:hypothetical protein
VLVGSDLEGATLEQAVFCRTIMPDGTPRSEGCP